MKLTAKEKINIIVLVSILSIPNLVFAQTRYEVTPSISVSELYDDNINLVRTDKESDYITTVSPSITLNVLSENSDLMFQYSPTFVRYAKQDQNNTVRHSGTLALGGDLTQHLRFEMSDTYLRSEDPVEETEGIVSVRDNRNVYQRNTGRVRMNYIFGLENSLAFGYNHYLLENEDITLDDNKTFDPFANLTYWFNVKNGVEFVSRYTIADFSRDDNSVPGDDFSGNSVGIRYLYRFTPHTTGSIGYDHTKRHFQGVTEDYDVNEGSVGFDHAFSPEFSLAVSGGYFTQKNERSNDESGYTYNISLEKSIDRGQFTLGGNGGWSEDYLEAERSGFTRYLGIDAGFEYQIMERLSSYAGASYRKNKEPGDREWRTVRANYGISWAFYQHFSLSLDYSSSARDDDINTGDYNANRIMLILSAGKMYRW